MSTRADRNDASNTDDMEKYMCLIRHIEFNANCTLGKNVFRFHLKKQPAENIHTI